MPGWNPNPIALRFLRNLLDAPVPAKVLVANREVELHAIRGPQRRWPRQFEGFNEVREGPWPRTLQVSCSWGTGQTRLDLYAWLYAPSDERYANHVGLKVTIPPSKFLIWVGLPSLIGGIQEGVVELVAESVVNRSTAKLDPVWKREAKQQFRDLVSQAGFKQRGAQVKLCAFRSPEGTIEGDPGEAIANVIRFALLKQHFVARDGPSRAEGEPLVVAENPLRLFPSEAEPSERANSIGALPGGNDQQKATVDAILDWLQVKTLASVEEMRAEVARRFGVSPGVAADAVRFMTAVGLIDVTEGNASLSDEASEYLQSHEARHLFKLLWKRSIGILELLVIIDEMGPITVRKASDRLISLLQTGWEGDDQASRRRNWLLSLGYIRRTESGDVISESGRALLGSYPEEVAEIRATLQEELVSPETAHPPRVDLRPEAVRPHLGPLLLPDETIEAACAALSCGNHLLLVGPPGTGKTQFARALAEAARSLSFCSGLLTATASADWTTFETVGGYALEPSKDGASRLSFRAGVFPRAIRAKQWLLIDELNRADVDKAFGELMTVLAGGSATLPYRDADDRAIDIGHAGDPSRTGEWTYSIPPAFRVIATMNTMDKGSLYQLSYALQRRFAILAISPPDDGAVATLIRDASQGGEEPPLSSEAVERLVALFSEAGLPRYRPIGPSIALDLIRYARRRGGSTGDALAEGLVMYLLPQLAGLQRHAAGQVTKLMTQALEGLTTARGMSVFGRRLREHFPELEAS